ncbi:MAG: SPFH domain-containing protein, partial [Stenotrophomonas bentonitica]
MKEKSIRSLSGLPFLLLVLALTGLAVWLFVAGVERGNRNPALIVAGLLLATTALVSLVGLYTVQPNQAAVVSLFGKYVGTVKEN